MADIARWASRDLRRAQADLDGWFSNVFANQENFANGQWPRTDIYEDTDGVSLRFEVPGLEANDVKVQVNENILTVSGERKLENEDRRNNYHRIESSYGSFERSFSLPHNLDTEKLQAQYKNGVVKIHVPRSERAKPRSVQVKVESASTGPTQIAGQSSK